YKKTTILNFIKPDKVGLVESDSQFGQFEFHPLEPGYGLTIGNALRRVLFASLEGYVITSVNIVVVDDDFSIISGVVEDMTEIILNLKKVRFKRQISESDAETVTVSISGQEQLTAGDLGKFISGFQILNPDFVIANMDKKVKLDFTFTIEKGRGYV